MDAAELRATQAPIKERYKSDPKAAMITLTARGSIENEGIACKVETGRALAVAGLHPATGGSGLELCSGDMLLEALVACAGVTLKSVATAIEVPLKKGDVTAEGDLDFRGTLGVDKEAPVGFAEIRLRFDVDTDAPQDKLDLLLKLTERYCVVYQTIKNGPKVSVTMQRVLISRRPGESRDPYAVSSRFKNRCSTAFAQHERLWLWVPAFAGTTDQNVPRSRFHPDARAAHGGHRRVRGVGVRHHRALGAGDRRAGRDPADFGGAFLRVSRARSRCGVHRRGRAGEPADQRRDDLSGPDLCRAGAAPERAGQLWRRGRGVDRAGRAGANGALVARRRPDRERRRLCDLPAAAAALPPRQDAADHAPLVRYPAARVAGCDAGGDRRHAVGLGRPQRQRHHRAVSGGVHQHDADPAPAHRRAGRPRP